MDIVQVGYRNIASDFYNYFYTSYDTNYYRLLTVLSDDTKITYAGHELTGARNFITFIEQSGITSFQHYSVNMVSQPVGDRLVLMQMDGQISFNHDWNRRPFVESILVDGVSGRILNYMFRM